MKTKFQNFTKILLIACLIIGYSCSNNNDEPTTEKRQLTPEEEAALERL